MLISSILFHIVCFLLFAAVMLVLTQDIQVFPGALFSLFTRSSRDPATLPQGVQSLFIQSEDGTKLETWCLDADQTVEPLPYVGIVFHGNGGSMENFLLTQLWFSEMGIRSYAFDYRGFGKSGGWPSEKGIYQDSDAFWKYVIEKEQIDASQIIVFGVSVGGAPAARIAALHHPKVLLMTSTFTSIKDILKEMRLIRFLIPFCRYRLSTIEFVRDLKKTNLLLLHGGNDTIVPPQHTEVLRDAYQGTGTVERLFLESSDHNMVFYAMRRELGDALLRLL